MIAVVKAAGDDESPHLGRGNWGVMMFTEGSLLLLLLLLDPGTEIRISQHRT